MRQFQPVIDECNILPSKVVGENRSKRACLQHNVPCILEVKCERLLTQQIIQDPGSHKLRRLKWILSFIITVRQNKCASACKDSASSRVSIIIVQLHNNFEDKISNEQLRVEDTTHDSSREDTSFHNRQIEKHKILA